MVSFVFLLRVIPCCLGVFLLANFSRKGFLRIGRSVAAVAADGLEATHALAAAMLIGMGRLGMFA